VIARLDDWLQGLLDPAEAEAFEEELLTLAIQGALPAEATFLDRAWLAGRMLLRGGTFEPGMTRADVARLEATGRKLGWLEVGRHTDLGTIADAEIVVMRVPLRADAEKVDLVTVIDGVEVFALRDLPVTPGSGEILCCCEGDRARASAGLSATLRIYVREGASRRLVDELLVDVT
jgi:hypothetical protein